VDRVTVVISLGLGLGVAIGALLAIRSLNPALDISTYEDFDDLEDLEDLEEDQDDDNVDGETARPHPLAD
jgi:hypothetical protein